MIEVLSGDLFSISAGIPILGQNNMITVTHIFVTSHVGYWNMQWDCLWRKKIHVVQNGFYCFAGIFLISTGASLICVLIPDWDFFHPSSCSLSVFIASFAILSGVSPVVQFGPDHSVFCRLSENNARIHKRCFEFCEFIFYSIFPYITDSYTYIGGKVEGERIWKIHIHP